MKKVYAALTLLILLALSLCTPAMAAMEYSVIYDETESLGSQGLTMQGEQTLPQLSQALGLDLRVDVLTQNSYDGLVTLLRESMRNMITAMASTRRALL